MELHKEELKLIELFKVQPSIQLTIKEAMIRLKKKSYNWTFRAVRRLSKDIFDIGKTGKTNTFRLNLESRDSIFALATIEQEYASKLEVPAAIEIAKKVSKKTLFFICLVTGSYATNSQKEGSDLDIVFIVDSDDMKRKCRSYIEEVARFSNVIIDAHLFTIDEFKTMLISDDENFGKEVHRKHAILYGAEAYYHIIKEAVKHGIQIKI